MKIFISALIGLSFTLLTPAQTTAQEKILEPPMGYTAISEPIVNGVKIGDSIELPPFNPVNPTNFYDHETLGSWSEVLPTAELDDIEHGAPLIHRRWAKVFNDGGIDTRIDLLWLDNTAQTLLIVTSKKCHQSEAQMHIKYRKSSTTTYKVENIHMEQIVNHPCSTVRRHKKPNVVGTTVDQLIRQVSDEQSGVYWTLLR